MTNSSSSAERFAIALAQADEARSRLKRAEARLAAVNNTERNTRADNTIQRPANAYAEAAAKLEHAWRRAKHARLQVRASEALLKLEYARIALRDFALQPQNAEGEGFQDGVGVIAAIGAAIDGLTDLRDHLVRDGRKVAAYQSQDVSQCHCSSPSLVDADTSSVGVCAPIIPPVGAHRPAPDSQHGPGAGHTNTGGVL